MGEGERRAYHDLMSEYADAKREAREARALVRELVEATELAAGRITDMMDSFDCYDPKDIAAVQRLRAALTRTREAGYGEKQAEPSSPPTQSAE